ncbi:hypothetical protein CB0940_01517 [Cercospora beticola]|uniref:Uncharacterized protein n=1 Tax=Cercospora beticola TaxID=122368 RepID=A0A2G5I7H2_CERBT|nr:hypothetical protein CB0940_01517 [Cercospora beticola]PIB00747.1 hypothetical protein CB0940_01517 [Cercospora beticola]WPA96957.1 hypothetical protein RHO25_001565 [Cercospora beticola]
MRYHVPFTVILGAFAVTVKPTPAPKNVLAYEPPTPVDLNITVERLASIKQLVRDERRVFDPVRESIFLNHSSVASPNHHKRTLRVRNAVTKASGNVALQDGVSIYYAPGNFQRGHGQQFAKLDVASEEKMTKVLNMEHFDDVINTAKCEKAGKVELTFDKEIQFQQVREEWQWINGGKEHAVILITENEHCDRNNTDGSPRQPWKATKAEFDDMTNKVHLTAEPINFEEAFGKNWHLKIQRDDASISTLHKRGGHISLNKDFSGYGINLPSSLRPAEVLSSPDAIGRLTCSTCAITGDIDFGIDIHGLWGGSLHVTASSISATVTLLLEIYTAIAKGSIQDNEIWGYVVPNAGIHIKGILDMGPTIKFLLSSDFYSPIDEQLAVQVGYKLSFPQNVELKLDVFHPTKPKLTGFDPKFEALPAGISDDLQIHGKIGPKLELSLDWKILGQGASVGFQFSAAELALNVTVDDRQPACGNGKGTNAIALSSNITPQEHNNTSADSQDNEISGVNLDLDLNQEIIAKESVGFWKLKTTGRQTLASTKYDLVSTCIPITGATKLVPTIASASVNTFIPWTGDLGDLATAKLVSGATEVASAYKELGESVLVPLWKSKLEPQVTSVLNQVTKEAVEAAGKVTSVEHVATSVVVSVATDVATKVENAVEKATDALVDAGKKAGDFVCGLLGF